MTAFHHLAHLTSTDPNCMTLYTTLVCDFGMQLCLAVTFGSESAMEVSRLDLEVH